MAIKDIDYNALGQSIDTTFGRSSTSGTATMSVKTSIVNESQLRVNFVTIVNFMNHKEMGALKQRYGEDATSYIKETLKCIKKCYKDLTGKSITITESDSRVEDDIEVINLGVHNPKRTAYYRRIAYYDIS